MPRIAMTANADGTFSLRAVEDDMPNASRLGEALLTQAQRRTRRALNNSDTRVAQMVRSELNLSQREMARALGVSQSFISKVENGERAYDALQRREIAAMLARRRAAVMVEEMNGPAAMAAAMREDGSPGGWPDEWRYSVCDDARALTSVEDVAAHMTVCVQCLAYVLDMALRELPSGLPATRPVADDGE